MPNHVQNIITVDCNDTQFREIALFMQGKSEGAEISMFDFNKLIPEEPNDPNWYDWRVAHWGTKWNAYETKRNSMHHCFRFLTA